MEGEITLRNDDLMRGGLTPAEVADTFRAWAQMIETMQGKTVRCWLRPTVGTEDGSEEERKQLADLQDGLCMNELSLEVRFSDDPLE